ncbi:hypothetical protein ACGFJT_07945 [Actinomadura geliboluensis]|uniref:hypothetical protein n=1 Tax=Actinomadura geliboluensis TaxID=882440 RepID=UPI0037152784
MMLAGYEWKSDFAKKHRAEGRAEGLAEGRAEGLAEARAEVRAEGMARAVLIVLEARGITVSGETRQRVTSCMDTDQLECWAKRAALVDKAEDLFA